MSLIVIPFGFSISLGNPVREDTLEVFRQLNVDVRVDAPPGGQVWRNCPRYSTWSRKNVGPSVASRSPSTTV